jgi:excisionase family DNA binding protein
MHTKKKSAFLTADEGHAMIGRDTISRRSFYNALQRHEIPSIRFGRRILLPRNAFMEWLAQRGAVSAHGNGGVRATRLVPVSEKEKL